MTAFDKTPVACEVVLKTYVSVKKITKLPVDKETKDGMETMIWDVIKNVFNPTVEEVDWILNNKDEFISMLKAESDRMWNNIIRHISIL